MQFEDPIHRGRTPLDHLLERDRIVGVAAVPAAEIHAEFRRVHVGAIRLVIQVLPRLDGVGVALGGGGLLEGDIGDEVGAGSALVHGGGRPGDLRAAQQGVFDFAQFDAVPAQLDLSVGTAEVVQGSVERPARQVAGAIQPRARGPVGIGHEPFRGQIRAAQVAARQRRSAQIQLADHPDGGGVQPRVEHQRAHPRERAADADRLPRHQRHRGGPDCGLGRAVAVEHAPPRRPRGHQLVGAGLTADDQGGQRIQPASIQRRQQRRGHHGRVDPLLLQQCGQRLAGIHLRRRDDQRAARSHRDQQLTERGVECRGEHRQHSGVRAEPERLAVRRGDPGQTAVGDRHALRGAGGPRREDHIRGVVRSQLRQSVGVGDRLGAPPGQVQAVDAQHRARAGAGHRVGVAGQHAHRADGVQHRRDPLDRVSGIHRHVHAAGFLHRPPRHHEFRGPAHRHAHRAFGAHPRLDQQPRQPRRPRVELAVGQAPGPIDDRHRVRVGGHRRVQQLRRHPRRCRDSGARPPRQHQITLVAIQQRQVAHHHRRIRDDRFDHPREPGDEALDGGPVIQVRGIGHDPGGHRCGRVVGGHLPQVDIQIEFGGAAVHRQRLDVEPVERHLGAHIVLEGQGHLKQRMVRRGARRVELLDQSLERHILIGVGVQRLLAHLLEHIAEPVRRPHAHPQHPGVDEEPDQLVQRRIHPPGDRGAHGHVLADPGPVQDHHHGRLQHHRGGRVMRRRQRLDPRPQPRVEVHVHRIAAVAGRRRARPIRRQRHHLGQIGQLLPPIGQLPGDHTVGIGLDAQPIPLPERVIGVLHRQRRPLRGPAPPPRQIGLADIPGHRSQ